MLIEPLMGEKDQLKSKSSLNAPLGRKGLKESKPIYIRYWPGNLTLEFFVLAWQNRANFSTWKNPAK